MRVPKPMGFSDVMQRTHATRNQMVHWSKVMGVGAGTGRHRKFSEQDVDRIKCAVKVARIWGGEAAVIAIRTGAKLPDGISDQEWMAICEMRRRRKRPS